MQDSKTKWHFDGEGFDEYYHLEIIEDDKLAEKRASGFMRSYQILARKHDLRRKS